MQSLVTLKCMHQTVTGVSTYYNAIADLFEPFEHFLQRLDSYVKFPLSPAMKDLIVKIFVELLSTLAHATRAIKEGKWCECPCRSTPYR
jgi:hypothetical protein